MPAPDTNAPGIRALCNAIALQAMTDYFILYRMGAVKELKSTGHFKERSGGSLVYQNMYPSHVEDLLEFFSDGSMSKVMDMMGHYAPPSVIRKRILHLERTGEWKEMFGQGIHLLRRISTGPKKD